MISSYNTESIPTLIEEPTQELSCEFIKRKNIQVNEISRAISETFLKSVLSSESENISIEFLEVAPKIKKAFDLLKIWEIFGMPSILLSKYEFQIADVVLIESKVHKISEDAELFISKNKISIEIINEIVEETHELLIKYGKDFRIELYIEKDKEIATWEELVISILVKEKDFNNIIKIWDEIGNIVEEIVDSKLKKYKSETEIEMIKEFDDKLTIEVKELENV
ncbi:MAG: hypothetical protein J7J51_00605 [Candidatus Omnitrophica bacterium]|nr:hypothetical protein [Candidatus Omnitrophota bacterium]